MQCIRTEETQRHGMQSMANSPNWQGRLRSTFTAGTFVLLLLFSLYGHMLFNNNNKLQASQLTSFVLQQFWQLKCKH